MGRCSKPRRCFRGSPAGEVFERNTGFVSHRRAARDGAAAPRVPQRSAQLRRRGRRAGYRARGGRGAASRHRQRRRAGHHRRARVPPERRDRAHRRPWRGSRWRGLRRAARSRGRRSVRRAALGGRCRSTRSTPAWDGGGVVLVEGSDLARADRYAPTVVREQRSVLRRDALRATDALVARLLERRGSRPRLRPGRVAVPPRRVRAPHRHRAAITRMSNPVCCGRRARAAPVS